MKFVLGRKAESLKRLIDAAGQPGQSRWGNDPSPEDSGRPCIGEKSHPAKRNLKALGANLAQASADGISLSHLAEKFQCDVIGVASDKTHSG